MRERPEGSRGEAGVPPLSLFRKPGPRTRRLSSYLGTRARARPEARGDLDARAFPRLFRRRAIVFTDTDDFTRLVARHGILHFLMLFDRAVAAAAPIVRRHGGDIVKVEGDSLLLRFPDVPAACRAVDGIETALAGLRRGKGAGQFLAFSYGIGFGDVLDLEHDVFGIEVNLASKLGEDMAERGEVLLTPAAAAEVPKPFLRRLRPHAVATFEGRAIPIQRLKRA